MFVYYATPPRRFASRAPNCQGFIHDPTVGSSQGFIHDPTVGSSQGFIHDPTVGPSQGFIHDPTVGSSQGFIHDPTVGSSQFYFCRNSRRYYPFCEQSNYPLYLLRTIIIMISVPVMTTTTAKVYLRQVAPSSELSPQSSL